MSTPFSGFRSFFKVFCLIISTDFSTSCRRPTKHLSCVRRSEGRVLTSDGEAVSRDEGQSAKLLS